MRDSAELVKLAKKDEIKTTSARTFLKRKSRWKPLKTIARGLLFLVSKEFLKSAHKIRRYDQF